MTPPTRRSLNEAAHKAAAVASPAGNGNGNGNGNGQMPTGVRRTFNEAAHKLGYWPVTPVKPSERNGRPNIKPDDDDRDVVAHAGKIVLALGALGVVYGDLGTSPLYTEQVIFTQHADAAHATVAGVYGVASLIFWALTIIVSIKYAGFLMRAHNRGDGGGMALAALIQRRRVGRTMLLVTLGIFGAGLFFGDGMVTPAISVTSAVEGLKVDSPSLAHLVVPISIAILIGLFALQRHGTGAVGWLFGPMMLLWFSVIAVLGAREVVAHPAVLQALSPTWAGRFMIDHGIAAFFTLGGVVLALTGAEALYADRGHFGATPIRRTWFAVVFPAVLLCYLGQSALILAHPDAIRNPFYLLVPAGGRILMVFLATIATIIASQAAITGSFSIARQAVQLGFLPRLKIKHTSELEGQIYVPLINFTLAIGVIALILIFRSSDALANIYGVAVTGTFVLDTVLFLAVARAIWHMAKWKLAVIGVVFLTLELSFFTSNVSKVSHGAWIPLSLGLVTAILMVTWRKGREIVTRNRTEEEGPLDNFLYQVRMSDPPIHRCRTVAIYLNPSTDTTPLALKADVEHHGIFHDKVLIVSVQPVSVPHVDPDQQLVAETLGSGLFKIRHITLRAGYHDTTDVPAALALARKRGLLERNLDLEHASYFVSRITITPTNAPGMSRWRKVLFMLMARNSASPIDAFRLPVERTATVGAMIPM
ncbi:MAG TPA: KUP/HAK/KT family potassium transporter [Solirubrobacteraceae bacterium]|nr:KUP/HAK/KT family potassium transporter [Solirubrobacteraceae bacterium]